jgi:hypothetical protein
MRATLFTALGVCLVWVPAAQAYCVKPSAPWCADGLLTSNKPFESDHQFRMCKMDVELFLEAVDRWAVCEATEQKNEVIEAFNCRARGGRLVGLVCFE